MKFASIVGDSPLAVKLGTEIPTTTYICEHCKMNTLNQKALEAAREKYENYFSYADYITCEGMEQAIQAYLQSIREQEKQCEHDWRELCGAEECSKCGVIVS